MPGAAVSLLRRLLGTFAVAVVLASNAPAFAWSEETHQTTGAIAWMDLASREDASLVELLALARVHQDYPKFQPFAARLSPRMHDRAVFEWLARWPDDIRGSSEDRPEWHYELRVVHGRTWLWPFTNGNASGGFAYNYTILSNPCATSADRAKAIGWLIHIVGDVQQPLHAGHQMTADFGLTDRAGELAFVRRAPGGEPTNLHYYWDRIMEQEHPALPAGFDNWASALHNQWPRSRMLELRRSADPMFLFASFLDESAVLARLVAYQGTYLSASPVAAQAPAVTARENSIALALAKRRIATGGYRIADVLAGAIAAAKQRGGSCLNT